MKTKSKWFIYKMSHREYKYSTEDSLVNALINAQTGTGAGDLVGILHDNHYTHVCINFDDEEYQDYQTVQQFMIA